MESDAYLADKHSEPWASGNLRCQWKTTWTFRIEMSSCPPRFLLDCLRVNPQNLATGYFDWFHGRFHRDFGGPFVGIKRKQALPVVTCKQFEQFPCRSWLSGTTLEVLWSWRLYYVTSCGKVRGMKNAPRMHCFDFAGLECRICDSLVVSG
jgi:hypothetical protein